MSGNKAIIDNTFEKYELKIQYDKIRLLELFTTKDLSNEVSKLGISLSGLEYSVKTASSVEDKVDRQIKKGADNSPVRILENMGDVIRYTTICNHDDIINIAKQIQKDLENKDYILNGISNYYKTPFKKTLYMGFHMSFVSPQGQVVEIQVHSDESFKVKQDGHEMYEIIRSVSTPAEEKNKVLGKIRKLHQSISKPKDYETIDNFVSSDLSEVKKLRKEDTNINIQYSTNSQAKNITKFDIDFKNEPMFKGFEISFQDNSAWRLIYDCKEKTLSLDILDSKGQVIKTTLNKNIDKFDMSMEDIEKIADEQINSHNKWMENFDIEIDNIMEIIKNEGNINVER